MTGHGEGSSQREDLTVSVEIRTVNSRYLKLSLRCTEQLGGLESRVEAVVRKQVKRGTIQVNARIERSTAAEAYQLNERVLHSYCTQLQSLQQELNIDRSLRLESLVTLPGVIEDHVGNRGSLDADWPVLEQALKAAITNLNKMRSDEGQAMAADLTANCTTIRHELQSIEREAPNVATAYRTRLTDKLNHLLSQHDIQIAASDVVREVGLFAERSDISEEVVRLNSHLDQFEKIMSDEESNGRKLDFVTQEMFRETNTIGSKANNADIARHVVEIKSAIERIREMVQNVE